uniref:28S ribosomal protein S30, mitochondrial n=1 Tax=Ditylenchus dipsaci TaxID=166011 RepID=A0A915EK43_9BILA
MYRVAPVGLVRPPYYRRGCRPKPKSKVESWLRDQFMTPADKEGYGPRLYDYYKTAELLKEMPIRERIEFVSPYERPWNKMEKSWHRGWHQPLMSTRKAWKLDSVPKYFDTLDFYKYITKTRVDDSQAEFNQFYENSGPSESAMDIFENRVQETLLCLLQSKSSDDKDAVTEFLRNITEDGILCMSDANPELALSRRISYTTRCESFWIRAGFTRMYERHLIFSDEVVPVRKRFPCDDRRRLGELAFTMRDDMALQIRSREPLNNLFEYSDVAKLEKKVFEEHANLDEFVLNPKVYNLWPDDKVLYQAPGYDADVEEPMKYGRLAVKNVLPLYKMMNLWKTDSAVEELQVRSENFTSIAVSSLFNWLNGQAHAIGHTQFTDVERPLTSQLILSTGKEFFFAIGQLNTIAINIDIPGFVNNTRIWRWNSPRGSSVLLSLFAMLILFQYRE